MRIFDVINTGSVGMLIVSKNEKQALEIAMSFDHVRNPASATVRDVTGVLADDPTHKSQIANILRCNEYGSLYMKCPEKKFGLIKYRKTSKRSIKSKKWIIKNEI